MKLLLFPFCQINKQLPPLPHFSADYFSRRKSEKVRLYSSRTSIRGAKNGESESVTFVGKSNKLLDPIPVNFNFVIAGLFGPKLNQNMNSAKVTFMLCAVGTFGLFFSTIRPSTEKCRWRRCESAGATREGLSSSCGLFRSFVWRDHRIKKRQIFQIFLSFQGEISMTKIQSDLKLFETGTELSFFVSERADAHFW